MIDAALATIHGKELLFGPRLERVGFRVVRAPVDTDAFGTFAGDVPRRFAPPETVVAKARAAAAATGLAVGVASEGSFAPHPDVPWCTVDEEYVALVDVEHDVVVLESCAEVVDVPAPLRLESPEDPVPESLLAVLPDQRLIVRVEQFEPPAAESSAPAPLRTAIGVATRQELDAAVRRVFAAITDDRGVLVAPDFRAHCCPARRVVIGGAIDRLAARLAARCPACSAIGFGAVRVTRARHCALCGLPTAGREPAVVGCVVCDRTGECPEGLPSDPATCANCNP